MNTIENNQIKLTDVRQFFIKEIYMPELILSNRIFIKIYEKSNKIIKKEIKKFIKKNKKNIKLSTISEYQYYLNFLLEEYNRFKFMEYLSLMQILENIVALWENQLNDFYKLERFKSFQSIKCQLKKDGYYDIDADNDLLDMINIVNYYKHGDNGKAEIYLSNTKYFHKNSLGIEDGSLSMKVLNIDKNYIKKFFENILKFWQAVLNKII